MNPILADVAVYGCGCAACNKYGFHMEVKEVNPKVTVLVGSKKVRHILHGRDALEFHVWWSQRPALDGKGKPQKVEFYDGGKFQVLPSGARGGVTRSSLVVKEENIVL